MYHIGTFIEPVTRFFGMGWQTFMAFIASAFAKEVVLGVLNAVFAGQGSLLAGTFQAKSFGVDSSVLAMVMPTVISKADTLPLSTLLPESSCDVGELMGPDHKSPLISQQPLW